MRHVVSLKKGAFVTILDWSQVIFLAIVVTASIGGVIKVIFFDKDD